MTDTDGSGSIKIQDVVLIYTQMAYEVEQATTGRVGVVRRLRDLPLLLSRTQEARTEPTRPRA